MIHVEQCNGCDDCDGTGAWCQVLRTAPIDWSAISFAHHSRAWYAAAAPLESGVVDDLTIVYSGGSLYSEFRISWHAVSGPTPWPRVEAFGDGIDALARVLPAVADLLQRDATPSQVAERLAHMGAVDATATRETNLEAVRNDLR